MAMDDEEIENSRTEDLASRPSRAKREAATARRIQKGFQPEGVASKKG
jgi:hypothetical protein